MCHFFKPITVALYVAIKSPFRKFLPIKGLVPIRKHRHCEVEISEGQDLNFFEQYLKLLEAIIKYEEKVIEGWRVDFMILRCSIGTCKQN
jgi:hypothetical protein